MSLYYVKRLRIPRGPERLRGLYAGARPSYFHSASPTNRVACPTTVVTQLPPQIPAGNTDPLVAGPSSAAGEGSVPLPCPSPEGNTESSTITLVPGTEPTEILPAGGTVECSPTSPQSAEHNPSVAHASSLAGGGSVSLPFPQQVPESQIENLSSEISSFSSSPLPSLPSVQALGHLDPFASNRSCSSDGNTQKTQPQNTPQTPVFIAQNTLTHLIPGGNLGRSPASSLPGTEPTEIRHPGGTVECSAPSPQSSERNPSVAHASSLAGGGSVSLPLPQQVPESKTENLNLTISQSSFPSSSLPSLRSVQASLPVFINQSSLPCSSFSRVALLPPLNIPSLDSPHLNLPVFLQTAPAKAASKKCIFGAVPKSGKSTRKHRKDTVQNTFKSPVFIDHNTPHSQNTEPVLRHFFTHRTKPHHPHSRRTENSPVEISNSEQLASSFSQLPQLPPGNVPLFHSHPFASLRGCFFPDWHRKYESQKSAYLVHIWCRY
jgi:hypothetical protein